MKVTILMQDFFGQGAQYAMAAIARGLIAKGVQVELLTSQVHRDLERKLPGGARSFSLPPEAKMIYLPSRKARYNILAVRRYLKKTDSFAVMSTSGPYHWCLRLAAAGLFRKQMIVLVNHGNFWWDDKNARMHDLPRRFSWLRLKTRWFHRGFDRELFVNDQSRENLLRVVPSYPSVHAVTVYNPVVDDVFETKVKDAANHPWLREKSCPTFVTAGAYCESKDHLMLLKAFKEIVKAERARLIVYGKGPLEADYRRFVAANHLEDVISIGNYTNNLPAEMKAADGFLMSSRWESFGIVLVEAMACGLPVVSTDAPLGVRAVLKNGKFGKIVPVGDYGAMAKEVIELIRHPWHPPEESWKPYTLEAVTDRYLAALK